MAKHPIRLAVVGGRRGASFRLALEHFARRVRLVAVCDLDQQVRAAWLAEYPGIHAYAELDAMLRDGVCDAVINATPMQEHAPISLRALNAGVHVLSEVPACLTHKEALALIRAVRRTGLTYMMAENYTYMRPHMMVLNMVRKGVFGDLTYAEGMYLHECWSYLFNPKGGLKWSGQLCRKLRGGNSYPTHSIGPIAQWLDIGGTDRFETIYSISTPPTSLVAYTRARFGARHPGVKPSYWSLGDSNSTLIRTKLGRVISLRVDWVSPRPHHMTTHELQGTGGCYRTQARHDDDPCVWFGGMKQDGNRLWTTIYRYADEFEHPRWKKHMATATRAGHGGGDFFEIEDFLDSIEKRKPNPIDVHAATTWSSVLWLSEQSEHLGRVVRAVDYFKQGD